MSAAILKEVGREQPVLIAGPTAAGKSALALEIAATHGGVIVNADALQVFANWHVLTARPSRDELSVAPHALYGHVAGDALYSVGHWLRDVTKVLSGDARPIVVGGTGLYFAALTQGLAQIPETPPDIRALADGRRKLEGHAGLLAELDARTVARIDVLNPMRVQRAWEVLQTTGRGLADWQDDTPPPLLDPAGCARLVLMAERDWLAERIARRFDRMMANGALAEAGANLATWDPTLPASNAIGAADLIAHLRGEIALDKAVEAGKIATRQYAKRQRTWFRSKMRDWTPVNLP